jgi:hypothetical protein
MARPANTPADQIARVALAAAETGPDTTGLRLAGDQALAAHGIDTPDTAVIILATDRELDWAATYHAMSEALRRREWSTAPRPDGPHVSWLLLKRPDGSRYSLTLVRQPQLRTPVIIRGVPVAALNDCLEAARRALAQDPSPANQSRVRAIEHAAEISPMTPLEAPPTPAQRPRQLNPAPNPDTQVAAQRRAELRADTLILARNLAAADLLGLTTPAAREDQETNLLLLQAALRAVTAAAQRTATSILAGPRSSGSGSRALARQVQQAHHRRGAPHRHLV